METLANAELFALRRKFFNQPERHLSTDAENCAARDRGLDGRWGRSRERD